MLTEAAISTATVAIGGEIAKSVLDRAEEAIEKISQNAAIRFSNIGQDLIAQLQVSVEELWKQIGDDINQEVAGLTDSLKVQLYNLTITTERLLRESLEEVDQISEDFVRDIRATLSKTWFMSEIYALDEIEGTIIPASLNTDWTISASGLNLGYDSDDIESVVSLKVKLPGSLDFEATGAEVSAHKVEFVFPKELIEERRRDRSISILDAELHVRIKKDGFLWFDKKFNGRQPFKLTLAPRIAGELFVRSTSPLNEWVRKPEYDVVYSNALPSGHATSSSDVQHHRITRYYRLPIASVPPRLGDKRFYAGERGACTGSGCNHLHEVRIRVTNNGSTLDVYTYNNSHAITVRIKGKVERYEKVDDVPFELSPLEIRDGKVLKVEVPADCQTIYFSGRDGDHGIIDLIVKRDPSTTVYPMPEGKFGGLVFLGSHQEGSKVIYRFSRR